MKKMGKSLILPILATLSLQSYATEILFLHVDNNNYGWPEEGSRLASMVDDLAGFNVTERNLRSNVYNDFGNFDQVWVYDLYSGQDNSANQLANYRNISNWYQETQNPNMIVDGRIISSDQEFTGRLGKAPEVEWIQNYALSLDSVGGGLLLGTDHGPYWTNGINTLNEYLGINPFYGNYGGAQAIVDPLSPLYIPGLDSCDNEPSTNCINDNSTTSFVPTGLQPNGMYLTPVAYHGTALNAYDNAAVSSTFRSATFPVSEPSVLSLISLSLGFILVSRKKQRLTKSSSEQVA